MKITTDSFDTRKQDLTVWNVDPGLKERKEVTCTQYFAMIFSTECDTDSRKLIYNVVNEERYEVISDHPYLYCEKCY